VSRVNVAGRVADDADAGMGASHFTRFGRGCADELRADGEAVAESAEVEPFAQAGLLNLDPADHFQIAGGNAQQGSARGEMAQSFFDAGHAHQIEAAALFRDRGAHGLEDGLGVFGEHLGWNAGLLAGLTQDRCIGAAVKHNAGQGDFKAGDTLYARDEGVDVDAVAGAQQGAINVKEIGILLIPDKTG